MKISTKGRYALRLMIDIAQNSSHKPVSIKEAARRQEISDKYLEQIISILNNAGYVKSIRGPQGGYILKMPPDKYTVGMILRLTEGSLTPVACASNTPGENINKENISQEHLPCVRIKNCPTNILWKKLDDAINNVVDNITLAGLIEWQELNNGGVE